MSVSAFDTVRPPPRSAIDACVHCGFCLPSCPTYLLWHEEMDSPRGRIYLMKAALDGRTEMTEQFVQHFDACLGCMACVTACPSGVDYARLIETTRAQIERRYPRGLGDRLFRRLLFAVLPYPARLRVAVAPLAVLRPLRIAAERAGLVKLLPARWQALLGLLPDVRLSALFRVGTARREAGGGRREKDQRREAGGERREGDGKPSLRVGLLAGCVQRVMFGHVNAATYRVLEAEGCEVVAPDEVACCGALSLHAGQDESARAFARRVIAGFERANVDRIVTNAAGCGSAMKEYSALLADDPVWADRARATAGKVRDVMELLDELGTPRAVRHPLPARVAYHDACHLAHAQGIRAQPRRVLGAIPGVEIAAIGESEICCGSAGIYNMVQPEPAAELGDRKVEHIAAVAPDLIATANPGCLVQIAAAARRKGHQWALVHPIEVVDASIRGISVSDLRGQG